MISTPLVVEGVKASDGWFPVIMGSGGAPVTGIGFGQVTAYYGAPGATAPLTYTIATADWAAMGNGNFWLQMGASEFGGEVAYRVDVVGAGADTFPLLVQVRDKTLAAWGDVMDALALGVIVSSIKTAAATFLAEMWGKGTATGNQDAGSLGEAVMTIRQVLVGPATANTGDNTIQIGNPDGSLRLTLTHGTVGGITTRTPS